MVDETPWETQTELIRTGQGQPQRDGSELKRRSKVGPQVTVLLG